MRPEYPFFPSIFTKNHFEAKLMLVLGFSRWGVEFRRVFLFIGSLRITTFRYYVYPIPKGKYNTLDITLREGMFLVPSKDVSF